MDDSPFDTDGRNGPAGPPDEIEDPELWCRHAVQACLEVWSRIGARYTRRVDGADRVRDVEDDVLALAARRVVPLAPTLHRPLIRPLPGETLATLALHFNRLDPADRFVLRRLDRVTPRRGSRTDHLASALERLAAALTPPAGPLRCSEARLPHGKRPPPAGDDGL